MLSFSLCLFVFLYLWVSVVFQSISPSISLPIWVVLICFFFHFPSFHILLVYPSVSLNAALDSVYLSVHAVISSFSSCLQCPMLQLIKEIFDMYLCNALRRVICCEELNTQWFLQIILRNGFLRSTFSYHSLEESESVRLFHKRCSVCSLQMSTLGASPLTQFQLLFRAFIFFSFSVSRFLPSHKTNSVNLPLVSCKDRCNKLCVSSICSLKWVFLGVLQRKHSLWT